MQTDSTYTKNQLKTMTDDELLSLIKKSWDISENEPISVIGKIYATYNTNIGQYHYRIHKIKKYDGLFLEYPISDLEQRDSISKNGIYTPSSFGASKEIKAYINDGGESKTDCELVLASLTEREKQNNPLLLAVAPNSIKILDEIEATDVIKDEHGNILVENSVVNYYTELNRRKINDAISVLNKEQFESKKKLTEITELNQKKIEEELEAFELKKEAIEDKLVETQNQYNRTISGLQNEEGKKRQLIDTLEGTKHTLIRDIADKTNDITILDDKIKVLRDVLKDKEDIMGKKLEKLRIFIKDKADTLLDLEFIDEEEYNNLLMINQEFQLDEKFVDFENDLQGDMQKAISHVQAYLFELDIVYSKSVLEDFFALVQTNDLIILAGESGSGKTNLIKSFAQAVGGKSFIIPVKPNWTSSEDLLGYYNPLEKKYLTTPFLEALLEAKDNPEIPYFICLDEMNLARVEYYFADFLSLLEERGEQPEIKLYSEDESSHILSEFKNVIDVIEHIKEKYKKRNIVNFIQLLQDEEINKELTRVFGFSDKDSLIKYHTDLRRMISGILNTPSSIIFPKNVRIIGAINIDETTHYLSPKILDRAHIMKFDSPLLQNWDEIANEIEDLPNKKFKIKFKIDDLGVRENYPSYDRENEFCKIVTNMTKEFFSPLGIEVGLRTIRQGLNYKKIWKKQNSPEELIINNFIAHKILPKMTFDGNKQVGETTKNDLLLGLKEELKTFINQDLVADYYIDSIEELSKIIKVSETNDSIVNYWA